MFLFASYKALIANIEVIRQNDVYKTRAGLNRLWHNRFHRVTRLTETPLDSGKSNAVRKNIFSAEPRREQNRRSRRDWHAYHLKISILNPSFMYVSLFLFSRKFTILQTLCTSNIDDLSLSEIAFLILRFLWADKTIALVHIAT